MNTSAENLLQENYFQETSLLREELLMRLCYICDLEGRLEGIAPANIKVEESN